MKALVTGALTMLLASLVVLAGCGGTEPAKVLDYAGLADGLRAAGAAVEQGGEINQDFFTVTGKTLKVNGEDVQVFEYAGEATAQAEANLVSADGGTIGTSSVFWVAPPHFYKAGKIIVLYVGETAAVTEVLSKVIGAQFAGR